MRCVPDRAKHAFVVLYTAGLDLGRAQDPTNTHARAHARWLAHAFTQNAAHNLHAGAVTATTCRCLRLCLHPSPF